MKLEAGESREVGRSHVIKRPRLTRLLDETDARIILLIAPAGYGKTTLAREWLANRPHSWYHANSATSDVAALALGLAQALSRFVPDIAVPLKTHLRASTGQGPEGDVLARILAEGLGKWPAEAWLVFDDYQFACDSEPSEQFVEHLVANSPIRLLVASRTRPRWATARRTLYGEVFEIGRALLSMTLDEADAMLKSCPSGRTDGLVALADGWPALIALAGLTHEGDVPASALPAELYGFFAEELYQAAPSGLRRALRRLALAPYITADIAETAIGKHADRFIAQSLELGFLAFDRVPPELHPLLKTFLASKFRKRDDDPSGQYVSDLAHTLIEREEWDEVFQLAARFADDRLLVDLFEASLRQMLDQSRLSTLERWITAAKARGLDSPIIDFAEGELSFRRGELSRAEALTCQAALRFDDHSPFASRSYWIAGTSAHLLVSDEVAAEYFVAAEGSARSDADARAALWGRFLAAEALERSDDAERLLELFASRCGNSVDERLRIATGRLLLSSLKGAAPDALSQQRNTLLLVERSRNPLIGSGYLNAYGWWLILAGRYEEALEAATSQRQIAAEHSLDFVKPFGSILNAGAQWGLRNFRACRASLAQCERTTTNSRLLAFVGQFSCRVHLANRRPHDAVDALQRTYEAAKASRSMCAEHLAWWALALAAAGHKDEAYDLSRTASSMSRRVDVSGLVPWVAAIVESRAASRAAVNAFETTLRSGYVDAFVTAYRSHPHLLAVLVADGGRREKIQLILDRAQDHGLADQFGISLPTARKYSVGNLTKRETEVLDLVSQGLMNKEIARALFITEATVKVHVRKICQKLGVRSRTEAAMRAAELSD